MENLIMSREKSITEQVIIGIVLAIVFIGSMTASSGLAWLFWIFVYSLVCGTMLQPINKAAIGFFLGLLLGPIGFWISWNMRKEADHQMKAKTDLEVKQETTKECPYCAETILKKAKVCRYCGKEQNEQSEIDSST